METSNSPNNANTTTSVELSSGHSSPQESSSEDMASIGGSNLLSSEKMIRALRERLEYTQLQLSMKDLECQALLNENCALRFTRRRFPNVSHEILQTIFMYATAFPGLSHWPWKCYRSESEWKTSSITRKSIPLVCRQWYASGLQFLYQHIVLETFFQITKIQQLVNSLAPNERVKRLSWIQGLELLLAPTPRHHIFSYWHIASELIMGIPPGNLKRFAIDSFHEEFFALSSDALHRVREDVEILQLGYSKYNLNFPDLLLFLSSQDASHEHRTVNFPKLRTIFFTTETHNPPQFSIPKILKFLIGILPQIKCIAFSWPDEQELVPECLELLKYARNLTDLYLTSYWANPLYDGFDELLEILPMLTHITISSFRGGDYPFKEFGPGIVHRKLETVTIVSEASDSSDTISAWGILLDKIRRNELPALKIIYIKAPHLSGCLDSPWMLCHESRDKWRIAIKLCRQKGIQLLSLQNHPIYLWEQRHGIRVKGIVRRRRAEQGGQVSTDLGEYGEEDDSDEYLTNTSDDSKWHRLETESDLLSDNSASEIDDDSDDEPYHYVDQPDIELYNPESDSSEGNLPT